LYSFKLGPLFTYFGIKLGGIIWESFKIREVGKFRSPWLVIWG